MTVNQKIISALKSFNLPIYSDFYSAKADEYFTFNYSDDRGVNHADDQPTEVKVTVQIHWFMNYKKDYLSQKKQIRKALMNAGFTYPTTDEGVDEPPVRHVVFECEILDEEFNN